MADIFTKYDLVDVDESFPIPEMPTDGLVLLVGSSGSGKTSILRKWFGDLTQVPFGDQPIYTYFDSDEKAEELLLACGLGSVPTWRRPWVNMSNGEQHRAQCALELNYNRPFLDEFSSVVDRDTAKSLSFAIQKRFRSGSQRLLVISTCHRDIAKWLNPDRIYDTDLQQWLDGSATRGSVHRPDINLSIQAVDGQEVWPVFKKHHYLSGKLNRSCAAFAALYNGKPVGFCSILAFPNGNFKDAWREHRTVVLPEFQGLGIGMSLSESVAQMVIDSGGRFFSKTSHPAFGESRNRSARWRGTSKNGKARKDYSKSLHTKEDGHKMSHAHRVCYSHEYIGCPEIEAING